MSMLSIIMPVLDEEASIGVALQALAAMRAQGAEIVVVDGGSRDGTVAASLPLCDVVIPASRGRGSQMHAGALASHGNILLFLHADTHLPDGALDRIHEALGDPVWGRFDVIIEGRHPLLPLVAWAMNARSRLTGIATGDQAIFVRRDAYFAGGGFADQPLMEDIAFSRDMKARFGAPACLRAKVTTSGRRWEKHGVIRTIAMMWRLRFAYYRGVPPRELAIRYGYEPRD